MQRLLRRVVMVGAFVLGLMAGSAEVDAATRNVAMNGTDGTGCGTTAAPCRTINQAIVNANPGDKIVVGPGRYTAPASPPCACVVLVDKTVTVESHDGALVTIIDAAGAANVDGVRIVASGVVFGGKGRGFTIRGTGLGSVGVVATSAAAGLVLAGHIIADNENVGVRLTGLTDHQVSDNVATGNESTGFFDLGGTNGTYARNTATGSSVGFAFINASNMVLTDNTAIDNGSIGFLVTGGSGSTYKSNAITRNASIGFVGASETDLVLEDNVLSANAQAVLLSGASVTATGNTVVGNTRGLLYAAVAGTVSDIRRNAFIGNQESGVQTANNDVTLTQNNFFGNGACGLTNISSAALVAPQNFWGASNGPGADPADVVCNTGPSTTVVTPVATKRFSIPVKAGE
jgi:parallel beta-helix repeat protein